MIIVSIHQRDVTIIHVVVYNNRAPNYKTEQNCSAKTEQIKEEKKTIEL